MGPRVRRREPETLCREAFSSQAMAVLHDPDTRVTTHCPAEPARTPRSLAFPLVSLGVEPSAGIEPTTPSLPWTHRDRCADRRFPRSRPTVGGEVIGSPPEKLCVLALVHRLQESWLVYCDVDADRGNDDGAVHRDVSDCSGEPQRRSE